jgi:K+-sensing histidine kinase KdpD
MNAPSKRPEDFLELVERAKRGRLKVYIGSAAGVGKTYQMLEEAHALKKRGVDVVLAFIEPHDRLDTAALIEGLEVVPRARDEYRGVVDGVPVNGTFVIQGYFMGKACRCPRIARYRRFEPV